MLRRAHLQPLPEPSAKAWHGTAAQLYRCGTQHAHAPVAVRLRVEGRRNVGPMSAVFARPCAGVGGMQGCAYPLNLLLLSTSSQGRQLLECVCNV